MKFQLNDGGRNEYFKAVNVGDCVTRAIAIAAKKDYKEVYDYISSISGRSARNGVLHKVTKKAMAHFGGVWVPCMGIGTGCKIHLTDGEIPDGRLVCKLSGHVCAVIDGVLNDTYDCTREGNRCVYGYWKF